MKLGEKLTELRTNVLRDKSDRIAGDADSLWTDETLLRYIKHGERKFARQTLCIRDATTAAVTQVRLRTGVKTYPLHQAVISVLSARYDTDSFDLARSGHGILNQLQPPEFLTFDPSSAYTVPPGRPSAYYTDETLVYATGQRVTLSVYPEPGADQDGKTIYLRTLRVPLTVYSLDHLDDECEIPEDYELDPLSWAAYLAEKNHDADAGSPLKAEAHKDAFDAAVAAAVRETKRKLFAHAAHRFGMGGFSWTR